MSVLSKEENVKDVTTFYLFSANCKLTPSCFILLVKGNGILTMFNAILKLVVEKYEKMKPMLHYFWRKIMDFDCKPKSIFWHLRQVTLLLKYKSLSKLWKFICKVLKRKRQSSFSSCSKEEKKSAIWNIERRIFFWKWTGQKGFMGPSLTLFCKLTFKWVTVIIPLYSTISMTSWFQCSQLSILS